MTCTSSMAGQKGTEVSNHFKYIANEFPVTLIFIGVDLANRGLFSEAHASGNITLAQTGAPHDAADDGLLHRRPTTSTAWSGANCCWGWRAHRAGRQAFPGMLADELSDYLYIRSSGHIGSLMTLINRGCQRAARTGTELLDQDLLDQVKLDVAAERARKALAEKFARRTMTTKPRPRAPKKAA